ncbi:hypothetical protein V1293_002967 [Bradyrhizobium sp. AZCC 1693]
MSGASGRFMPATCLEVHQHSSAVEPKSPLGLTLFVTRLNGWNRHVNWVLCWVRRSRLMTLAIWY